MKPAIVTASYSEDLQRCELLCETMGRRLLGDWHHYILVEDRDHSSFAHLAGPQRSIIAESELLPGWMRAMPDPTTFGRRRLWVTPFSLPMRGWHAQQLRRLAIADHIDEDLIVSVDSDVVFVRDFNPASFFKDGKVRLYSKPGGISLQMMEHRTWFDHANRLLNLPDVRYPAPDYINTLIAWDRRSAQQMLRHIEDVAGKNWVRAVISSRAISECTIYGRYVEGVLGGEGHFSCEKPFCHVLWREDSYERSSLGLQQFVADLAPHQVALGVQSFVAHDLDEIRAIALG